MKYERAKAALLERIGGMMPGAKLPSIQALRDELSLSQGTIMRAINDLAEDGVIERRPNRGAFVARRRPRANNILVVWPDLVEQVTVKPLSIHPNTSRILHSVQEAAGKLNKNLLITRRLGPEHPEFDVGSSQVSGVLILFNYDRHFVQAYKDRGIPVVLIDPLLRVHGVPFVMKDHSENAREATLHLIGAGHQRVVYVAIDQHLLIPDLKNPDGIASFVIEERIRGYELAMREAGLKRFSYVYECTAQPWAAQEKDAFAGMLRSTGATACVCFNDDIAARVLGICKDRGIAVPEELSIIGHDDAEISRLVQPALTTIQPPLEEMGRQAIQLLHEQIEARATVGRGIVVPSKLVERESVAPCWQEAAPAVSTA